MLPALQPSRPRNPQQQQQQQQQQQPPHPSFIRQQQRAVHEQLHPLPLSSKAPSSPRRNINLSKPRSHIEAMPLFGPAQSHLFLGKPMGPAPNLYDSALRHPVFFTEQLRKPPFPIPEIASQEWSPVASGYVMENRKTDGTGIPKTKL
ncbi:hypothetical protein K469DRAFT_748481 [Zopfia rhizophila CBS 207.26]|uniref:Uncharacterized protein n=1 Tax=Zopfia rhizophila CBS 207.26 TaxID=1314779 RepID=A0A6A6E8H7_9PEZI|nr:hypothetical protein K469DRAFT_748481 [Zopfia rhizophila CBS 207.26]